MSSTPLPPQAVVFQLCMGKVITKLMGAMCRIKAFDHIPRSGSNGASAAEIAGNCGAKAEALYRGLRALSVAGLTTESADKTFTLTPAGALLRTDEPGSMAGFALLFSDKFHDQGYHTLETALCSNEPSFDKAAGQTWFEYLETHADAGSVFQGAMTSFSNGVTAAALDAYDFSPYKTVCDIGGGHGTLLSAVLTKVPTARGIVFELPRVAEGARAAAKQHPAGDRIDVQSGNMFEGVPSGVDLFVMKHIIHDWGNPQCIAVLSHCAKALNPGGRVVILEHILAPPGVPDPAKILDIEMMVMTHGGVERTKEEFEALLSQSGLKLTRVVPLPGPVKLIEAVCAT